MPFSIEVAKDEDLHELMQVLWTCLENPPQEILRVFFPILNADREASLLAASGGQRDEYREAYPKLIWLKVVDEQTVKIIADTKCIMTACSAQLKPFLDSLRSSGMRFDAITGSYQYKSQRYHGYDSNRNRSTNHSSNLGSQPCSINLRSLTGRHVHPGNELGASSEASVSASKPSPDWDEISATSQSQIIREVRTFTVTEERRRSSDADDML